MCGIAFIASNNKHGIERMTQALRHRGPDGMGTAVRDTCSLGHARLAILDPRSEGGQPMWNEANTIGIVFNGEIYNFRELAKEYDLMCLTGTDTEVILKLYEKLGADMLPLLQGMFAFAIVDTQKNEWLLARDFYGIKPLFYTIHEGDLWGASELRALIHGLPNKPELNLEALSQYLRLQYVPGPDTLCEGIQSLPSGAALHWKNGSMKTSTFAPRIENHTNGNIVETMEDSVRRHLVSDKPVGMFLSGGMDSSILLHHMSKLHSEPVHTFTVRFDVEEHEDPERFNRDAELARMTAKHYGATHTECTLTAKLFAEMFGEAARYLDQPNSDTTSVALLLLSQRAKKDVDVVLTGTGGDELFGGYPRYRIARILEATKWIPSGIRKHLGKAGGLPQDIGTMHPGAALAERLLARKTKEWTPLVRGNWFDGNATTQLFANRYPATSDAVRDFCMFDRSLWLQDEALKLTDGMTMGNGLEARVPFLDAEVQALADSESSNRHVTYRTTKALLKKAYRPLLPEHLFTLKKASFFTPIAKWIRRDAGVLIENMLEHKRMREYFNMDEVRTLFEKHRNHEQYALHSLLTLLHLQHWFDEVYDAQ